MSKASSMGGQKMAFIQRQAALKMYFRSPNICRNCGEAIDVVGLEKVSVVRRKMFCNSSCSAKYFNSRRQKKIKSCMKCGFDMGKSRAKLCHACKTKDSIARLSSGSRGNHRSCRNASRRVYGLYGGEFKCIICGYTFKPSLVVHHINGDRHDNRKENLACLCANHHGEAHHGKISKKDLLRGLSYGRSAVS